MTMTDKEKQGLLVGGILGGVVLVIILYFHFFMLGPEIEGWKAEIVKAQTNLDKNKKTLTDYKKLLADTSTRQQVEEAFARVSSRLPPRQDPIDVFDLLKGYFEGTDVQFSYLEPGRRTRRGRYFEYPFVIRGSSRYHEFGQLVNLVECNPDRLMHVTSFKLTNNTRRPSIHPMEIGISTFTFDQK